MKEEGYLTRNGLLLFLAGGLAGAGIALLTAPQSGKKTRKDIERLTEDATHKIKSVARESADKIMDIYKQGIKRVA
jgi:gas vesicle protein